MKKLLTILIVLKKIRLEHRGRTEEVFTYRMNPIKQNSASGAIPVRFLFLWGDIEMLSSFPAYISMRLSNSSAKMEFNSRLDDKITACGGNQKWQLVTPQYRSILLLIYVRKTANAKSAVLKISH